MFFDGYCLSVNNESCHRLVFIMTKKQKERIRKSLDSISPKAMRAVKEFSSDIQCHRPLKDFKIMLHG